MQIDRNIPIPELPGAETRRYTDALLALQVDESILLPRALYYKVMPNLHYHLKKKKLPYKYVQRAQADYITYRVWRSE